MFFLWICVLVAPAVAGSPRSLRDFVGFYHWGGRYTSSISGGTDQIAALNAHIARVTLSARSLVDYNRSASCQPAFSLARVLDDSDVRAALGNPALDVVMITAYDGASYSDCVTRNYLSLAFYTPANTAAVVQEYRDFVVSLYQAFAKSGKRFIISNWEGDNAIYCDSAYVYRIDESFRQSCDQNYPMMFGGNAGPPDSIQGMIRWLQAKGQGIAEGKARSVALGLDGVEVYFAPEISSVRALKDRGLPSVLYDVLPNVSFDYVSYSSYESINVARPDIDPGIQLSADLDLIRSVAGTAGIILGEAGYPRSYWGDSAVPLTAEVEAGAIAWGVLYVIHWNLYDQDDENNFGLFDFDGAITPIGEYYRGQLSQ